MANDPEAFPYDARSGYRYRRRPAIIRHHPSPRGHDPRRQRRCWPRPAVPLPRSALLVAPTRAADLIRLVPDTTVNAPGGQICGQITAETPTKVTIKPAVGASRRCRSTRSTRQLRRPPAELLLAQSRENAASSPRRSTCTTRRSARPGARTCSIVRPVPPAPRVLADIALADPRRGRRRHEGPRRVHQGQSESRQVGPALESLVRLSLQQGDADRAETALKTRRQDPLGRRPRGRCCRPASGSKRARRPGIADLDRIIAAAPKGSAQAREALLAKAEVLVALKKFAEAEPPSARSSPGPARGRRRPGPRPQHPGRLPPRRRQPKDALIAYLQTDILYSSDKAAAPPRPRHDRPALDRAEAGQPRRRGPGPAPPAVSPEPLRLRHPRGPAPSSTGALFLSLSWVRLGGTLGS